MRLWRLRNFALVSWIAITIPAYPGLTAALGSADRLGLLNRRDPMNTCNGNSSLTYCGNGLPVDFCCSKGSTCISLNNTGTASAICCPGGARTCDSISTIGCDTSLAGPAHPDSPILLLNPQQVSFPTCGDLCCPLGYECGEFGGKPACNIKSETRQPQSSPLSNPSPSTTSASAIAKPTSSSTSSLGGVLEPSTIRPTEVPSKFTAGAVLVGLFPGIILGILGTLGIIFFLRRRRNRQGNDGDSSFFGSPKKKTHISEPIYQPGISDRSDFMHIRSASGNSNPPTSAFDEFYKPAQNGHMTTSTGTLFTPTQQEKNGTAVLGPPFETPTRAYRGSQQPSRVRSLFSKSPRTRPIDPMTKSRATLGRSAASLETIDVLLPTAPPQFNMLVQDLQWVDGNGRPETPPPMPTILYADVYKAAGISPPKSADPGSRPF